MVPNHIHVSSYHRRKFLALIIALLLVIYVSLRLFWSIGDLAVSSPSGSAAFHHRTKVIFDDDDVGGGRGGGGGGGGSGENENEKVKKVLDPRLKEMGGRAAVNKMVQNKQIYTHTKEWFLKKCFDKEDISDMSFDFFDLYLEQLAQSSVEECRVVHYIFMFMFDMEIMYGPIEFGKEFEKKMLKWLNNSETFLKQSKNQKIIKIYNKYYKDEMIYNSLRGKRPVSSGGGQSSEKNYSLNIIKETRDGCDFCNNAYKTNTANDIFDRLESKLSFSSANAFKYDKWHSLISSRNHNPLNLTEEELTDMFSLTLKWFQKVNDLESSAQYPQILWDAMPKSGASQIHPHLQVSMGLRSYYGMMRRWLEASGDFFLATFRDFYDEFLLIHKALGLVYQLNDSYVIVNIIPIKDQEIMIVGKSFPDSYPTVVKLFHQVTRVFIDKFQQYSFSAAMYLPKFETRVAKTETPQEYNPGRLTKITAKILFRSSSNMIRSDFNGLDLYTSSVVGIDRYALANKLFKELDLMNSSS